MNRKLFESLPEVDGFDREAFINSVMDENGRDIEKAKGKTAELQTLLDKAQETITSLETNKGNAEELEKQLEQYRLAEEERKNAEEKATKDRADKDRFDRVANGKNFLNDFTRDGVMAEFLQSLDKEENKGKSDTEIFSGIVADKNYFVNPNSAKEFSGAGKGATTPPTVTKEQIMAIRDTAERQKAIAENINLFEV